MTNYLPTICITLILKKTEKWQTHKHRPFNILQRCIVDKLPAYFFNNQIFKVGPKNHKSGRHTSTAIFQHCKESSLTNYLPTFCINWILKVGHKKVKYRHTTIGLLQHCKEISLTNYLPTFLINQLLRIGPEMKSGTHTSTGLLEHIKNALFDKLPTFFLLTGFSKMD